MTDTDARTGPAAAIDGVVEPSAPSADTVGPLDEPLDETRAGEFAERMVGVLGNACLALMASIGHRAGLFDTMAGRPPSTSQAIAAAANLDERYVREWLGAVTTARVVTYDPTERTYWLPPEHAAALTRAAGPNNLARPMQFVGLLAGVEQPLVECFRAGGGLSYAAYEDFHRLMAEESGALFDAALVDRVVPLVPGLAERLSAGIDVADVGCGSGHAVNVLAAAFPASRFTGYDFAAEGVEAGRREALAAGLSNTEFVLRDVAALNETRRFDLVTAFDAIHDQARPATVLAGVAGAVRPGGVFLMADMRASSRLEENVDHPLGTFLYTVSTMHCMTVSLGLGGVGLGTVWGEQLAQAMLADAGFVDIELAYVDDDVFNTYYVARKP